MSYAIIGTGVAAISAIQAIRSVDSDNELTVIGADPHGYYSRPGLAYYLSGEIPQKELFPFDKHYLKRHRAQFLPAQVTQILPQEQRVVIAGNDSCRYDRLLLATGAASMPLGIPGSDLHGVVKIDDLADACQMASLAERAGEAVVIGGGVTALELVEGLVARKTRVHYFLRGDRYWSSVLDAEESQIILKRLKDEGVRIHIYTEAAEILGKQGKVIGVRTTDGETVPALSLIHI